MRSQAGLLLLTIWALAPSADSGYLCEQLEEAIDDYFADDDYEFTLYRLMGFHMGEFVTRTRNFKGMYDVHDEDERHELACHLASVRTSAQLREVLDRMFGDTKPTFSAVLLEPIANSSASIGSVARLNELADLYVELLGWADRNHYPILPLRVNRSDTMKTLTTLRPVMTTPYIHRFLHKGVFPVPVHMTPYQATRMMEDATSYSALDRALGAPRGTVEAWASELQEDPELLRDMADDIDGLMAFIRALYNTGRFP